MEETTEMLDWAGFHIVRNCTHICIFVYKHVHSIEKPAEPLSHLINVSCMCYQLNAKTKDFKNLFVLAILCQALYMSMRMFQFVLEARTIWKHVHVNNI